MFPRFSACGCLLFLGLVGCGSSGALSTAKTGAPPPHGGTIVLFPNGKGLVEVVKKEGKAPITSEVSFYFFKDAYTPYEPMPKTGVLVLDNKQQVPLQAEGDALVTPPGPVLFGDKDVDGRLSIKFDDELIRIPLGIR